jgi:phage gp16-like protein
MAQPKSNDKRNRLIKLIHVARRELGMDEDTYRMMMAGIPELGGKTSCSELNINGLNRVLDELKKKGFKVRGARSRVSTGRRALASKIRAQLLAAGKPEAYADGMAKKMFGVDRWEWCDTDQLHKIVAALNYQDRRERSRQKSP